MYFNRIFSIWIDWFQLNGTSQLWKQRLFSKTEDILCKLIYRAISTRAHKLRPIIDKDQFVFFLFLFPSFSQTLRHNVLVTTISTFKLFLNRVTTILGEILEKNIYQFFFSVFLFELQNRLKITLLLRHFSTIIWTTEVVLKSLDRQFKTGFSREIVCKKIRQVLAGKAKLAFQTCKIRSQFMEY